jgi:hypothetical protein
VMRVLWGLGFWGDTGAQNPSLGKLKLMPLWDLLLGNPRFEKIVNSLAPR